MNDSSPQPIGKLEETKLRDDILAYLKKAYFNARTDVVGEQNDLLENSRHALPTLNNMTNELVAAIQALVAENMPKKRPTTAPRGEMMPFNESCINAGFNEALTGLRSRLMRAGLIKKEGE